MKKLMFLMLFVGMAFGASAQMTDLSNGAFLDDAELRLRNDVFQYLRFSNPTTQYYPNNQYLNFTNGSGINGPELSGWSAGRLVTQEGEPREVLLWNRWGNVGIGTNTPWVSAPSARLHVNGGNLMVQQHEPKLILRNDYQFSESGNVPSIEFDNGTLPIWKIDARVSGVDELSFQNYDFATSSHIKVMSMNDETVGIGTDLYLSDNNRTTSNGDIYRLYVKGGIKTEEVKVELGANNNWADYVFAENYPLLSLPEVEQHIQQNGHLHNIPSAAEIEKEGLELKSMTINQQEKIEELYLHLIEMDKRMKALEKENAELKATLNQ